MASMLASKHRSSSFSFLPKKTMIATHSASCPLPERKTLSGQSSRLRRNFTANLFTLSHSHYYSFTFSITFLPRNIVVILRIEVSLYLFQRGRQVRDLKLETHEIGLVAMNCKSLFNHLRINYTVNSPL